MALVLISQYRIYGDKIPHWVVVSGFDDRFVYVSDPDIGEDHEPFTGSDCLSVPILRHEFDLMARYGRDKLQAAVFIDKKGRVKPGLLLLWNVAEALMGAQSCRASAR